MDLNKDARGENMTSEEGGTCQFCEKFRYSIGGCNSAKLKYGGKVKYGVRHYAHWECFLANKGLCAFKALPEWKQKQAPYLLLKEWGISITKAVTGAA